MKKVAYNKYLADFEPVIGLEVHTQLTTASKAFSPEPALFGAPPNSYVDAVTLAHPGALPVLNEKLPEFAILLGLALDCKIRPTSYLARKHYFYPDLPKGYQISQFEDPICFGGKVQISLSVDGEEVSKDIGITRIHMEEDAGKSSHDLDPNSSLIDLNRCGTPLLETVSEPEIASPEEAVAYLKKVHEIVVYLRLCDGNMEEGSFRCDANISVRPRGQARLGTKAEIKNMNSFRHVESALKYEFVRQAGLLSRGEKVVQETRLWDPDKEESRSMRGKEEAHDYRYFPDPDLVRVDVDEAMLQRARFSLPEMPEERVRRYIEQYSFSKYDAEVLLSSRDLADYFDACIQNSHDKDPEGFAKHLANILMTEGLRVIGKGHFEIVDFPIQTSRMAELVELRNSDTVNSSAFVQIFNLMLYDRRNPALIAEAENLIQVSDLGSLEPLVDLVLSESPVQVDQYRSGKTGVIGFLIGQVMKRFDGSPDPKLVKKMLEERIGEQ